MSHPRQDEDRRLGQNDESEAAKAPGSMRGSSPSEETPRRYKISPVANHTVSMSEETQMVKGRIMPKRSEWISAIGFMGLMPIMAGCLLSVYPAA